MRRRAGGVLVLALLLPPGSSSSAARDVPVAGPAIQVGDVRARSGVVWARCPADRDATLVAAYAKPREDGGWDGAVRELRASVDAASDFARSFDLADLEPATDYRYQVSCETEEPGPPGQDPGPVEGRFATAPAPDDPRPLSFVWAADLAGQGYGRNPDLGVETASGRVEGGYTIFEVMRRLEPDFAIFQGDMIYADDPLPAELPERGDRGAWRNEPPKDFVALTLEQYRANWSYNLGDPHLRRFLRQVPVYAQWDDHEVTNNWYPGEVLEEAPYEGLSADALAVHARRAFFEFNAIEGDRIYRSFRLGRHLELFLLDCRSYRGPNPENAAPEPVAMLGRAQLDWLKLGLARSEATWKIISSHDPLSIVTGGEGDWDAWGQGASQLLGREFELAELLRAARREGVEGIVFLGSDVHFAAAIDYQPLRATIRAFAPFLEFVAGPAHAGGFGPGELDPTFGPRYVFAHAPGTEGRPQNQAPPRFQSFGRVQVDETGTLTVGLHDATGAVLYEHRLEPGGSGRGQDGL